MNWRIACLTRSVRGISRDDNGLTGPRIDPAYSKIWIRTQNLNWIRLIPSLPMRGPNQAWAAPTSGGSASYSSGRGDRRGGRWGLARVVRPGKCDAQKVARDPPCVRQNSRRQDAGPGPPGLVRVEKFEAVGSCWWWHEPG